MKALDEIPLSKVRPAVNYTTNSLLYKVED